MLRTLIVALSVFALGAAYPLQTIASAPLANEYVIEKQKPVFTDEDVECLSQNIYFEARNQKIEGQFAIAEVVLNRMSDGRFPNSVCKVVKQITKGGVCQFSWYCDGKSDRMRDKEAASIARFVATSALLVKPNLTDGAIFYHAKYVNPKWAKSGKIKKIQDHVFYGSI